MKKLFKLCMVSFVFLLCACSSYGYHRDDSKGKIVDLSVQEFVEKVQAKESFAVVITMPDCDYCKDFKKMVKKYLKNHNVTLYEIHMNEKTTKQRKEHLAILRKTFEKLESTPTLYYVEKGIQEDEVLGNVAHGVFDDFVVDHKLDEKK